MAAVTTLHTASWGINPEHRVGMAGSLGNVKGVVVEWDETSENVSADEANEVGSNIGKTIYDRRYNVNCVVQVPMTAVAPKPGAYVQVTSNGETRKYFVATARVSESNSNYRRIIMTLQGSYYSNSNGFLNVADGIASVS